LLADAPRHQRGRPDAQTHRERVDHGEQRFGEPHRRHRVRPQVRDPENVGHGEDALERHLEHHRYREQQNGAADGALGEVVMHVAPDGFLDHGPEAGDFRGRRRRVEASRGFGQVAPGEYGLPSGKKVAAGSSWAKRRMKPAAPHPQESASRPSANSRARLLWRRHTACKEFRSLRPAASSRSPTASGPGPRLARDLPLQWPGGAVPSASAIPVAAKLRPPNGGIMRIATGTSAAKLGELTVMGLLVILLNSGVSAGTPDGEVAAADSLPILAPVPLPPTLLDSVRAETELPAAEVRRPLERYL